MAQLPMMGFNMNLLKAGVTGWWYNFIGKASFDAIGNQFSFLSRTGIKDFGCVAANIVFEMEFYFKGSFISSATKTLSRLSTFSFVAVKLSPIFG